MNGLVQEELFVQYTKIMFIQIRDVNLFMVCDFVVSGNTGGKSGKSTQTNGKFSGSNLK